MRHFHITLFQTIPKNSSVKTNFKCKVKVFSKWFVFVRVKADERSVVRKKTH